LEDPERNTKEYLLERATALAKLTSEELEAMKRKAQEKAESAQATIDAEIKKKYFVE
jgi:hypothetical protein